MTNIGGKIVAQGSVYFIGNILRHTISFIMLPIYTRVLTPEDYGIIELLSIVIDFAGVIFGLRIGDAIFRYYLEYERKVQKYQVISTALILTTLLNFIGFLVLWGLSGSISKAVFGGTDQKNLLVLFSISLLFQPLVEIPMTFIRAKQRPWLFVSFSSIKLTIQLLMNIYLVVIKEMGVEGVILSAVASGGLMALTLGIYTMRETGFRFSGNMAKTLTKFSYPMIIASLISFYITFGDRYFLKLYGTLTDVGIYGLGYKFGMLLSFIGSGPFFSIWDSEKYNVLKKPEAIEIFQKVFILYTTFTLMIVVVISIFSKNIIMVMASSEFWDAYKIVPVILLAYFFQGWTGFCSLGILIHNKTFIITQSTVLSAIIISIFYLLLIPEFGSNGAAWATAFSFASRFLYTHLRAKNLYDMELPWKKVSLLILPGVAAILVSLFGSDNIVISFTFNVIIFGVFLYIISIMPVLPVDMRLAFHRLLLRPWNFAREFRQIIKSF
jgi:O-antigen/teichoic acid export membrane protein